MYLLVSDTVEKKRTSQLIIRASSWAFQLWRETSMNVLLGQQLYKTTSVIKADFQESEAIQEVF